MLIGGAPVRLTGVDFLEAGLAMGNSFQELQASL
jgi:hypothetical protein